MAAFLFKKNNDLVLKYNISLLQNMKNGCFVGEISINHDEFAHITQIWIFHKLSWQTFRNLCSFVKEKKHTGSAFF